MQSPTSTPTPLQRHASQQAEYEALLTALSAVQTASSEISGYYMPPQADSPLGIEHNHAQALLLALFEDAGDKVLSEHCLLYTSDAADE